MFPNKTRFEDIFLEDKYHGPGKLYMLDGSIIDANWSNGQINGEGVYIKSNGR